MRTATSSGVVDENARFALVKKLGEAGEIARAEDPRSTRRPADG
jgi:hypothetical protein